MNVRPKKISTSINYMDRIVNLPSSGLIPGSYMSPPDIEAVDYRPYKSVIESLFYCLNTQGNPAWPTEIVIDFAWIDETQRRRGIIQ